MIWDILLVIYLFVAVIMTIGLLATWPKEFSKSLPHILGVFATIVLWPLFVILVLLVTPRAATESHDHNGVC